MIVNVINLPQRTKRLESFKEQAKQQDFWYKVWPGIIDPVKVCTGISQAHKQIIRDAKEKGLEYTIVCEDDINFLGEGSFDYFIYQKPENFDLYLAMIYQGKIDAKTNRIVKDKLGLSFSGLTMYMVHSRFYDAFLGMDESNNIDRELGTFADKYEYYVCDQFTCKQRNGFSDNRKEDCRYDHLLHGRKLFNKK